MIVNSEAQHEEFTIIGGEADMALMILNPETAGQYYDHVVVSFNGMTVELSKDELLFLVERVCGPESQ